MFDYTTNSTNTLGERHLSKTTSDIVETSAGNWNLQQHQGSSPTPSSSAGIGRHPPNSAPSSQDQTHHHVEDAGVVPLSASAMASMGPKVVSGLVSDSPLHPQIRSGSAATTAPSSPLRNLHQRQSNIVGANDLRPDGGGGKPTSTTTTANPNDADATAHRLRFTEDCEGDTATNTPRRDYEQCSFLSIESPQTPQFASNLPHISTSNVSMFDALLFCPSVPFHAFIEASASQQNNHTSATSVANSDEFECTRNNYLDQQLLLGDTSSSAGEGGNGGAVDPSSMLRRFYEIPSNDVFSPLTPLQSNAQLMMAVGCFGVDGLREFVHLPPAPAVEGVFVEL